MEMLINQREMSGKCPPSRLTLCLVVEKAMVLTVPQLFPKYLETVSRTTTKYMSCCYQLQENTYLSIYKLPIFQYTY